MADFSDIFLYGITTSEPCNPAGANLTACENKRGLYRVISIDAELMSAYGGLNLRQANAIVLAT